MQRRERFGGRLDFLHFALGRLHKNRIHNVLLIPRRDCLAPRALLAPRNNRASPRPRSPQPCFAARTEDPCPSGSNRDRSGNAEATPTMEHPLVSRSPAARTDRHTWRWNSVPAPAGRSRSDARSAVHPPVRRRGVVPFHATRIEPGGICRMASRRLLSVASPSMNARMLSPSPPSAVDQVRAGLERSHPLAKYCFRIDHGTVNSRAAAVPG